LSAHRATLKKRSGFPAKLAKNPKASTCMKALTFEQNSFKANRPGNSLNLFALCRPIGPSGLSGFLDEAGF